MPARRAPSFNDDARPNEMLDRVLGPQRLWLQPQAGSVSTEERAQANAPAIASSTDSTSIARSSAATPSSLIASESNEPNHPINVQPTSLPSPMTTAAGTPTERTMQPTEGATERLQSGPEPRNPSRGSVTPRGRPRGRPRGSGRQTARPTPIQPPPSTQATSPTPAGMQSLVWHNYVMSLPPQQAPQYSTSPVHAGPAVHHYMPYMRGHPHIPPHAHGGPPPPSANQFASIATSSGAMSNKEPWLHRVLYPPRGFDGRTTLPYGPGRSLYQAYLAPKFTSTVSGARWLLYVAELTMQPILLDGTRLIEGELWLSESEYVNLLKPTKMPDGSYCHVKRDREPALQFYINCIKMSSAEGIINEQTWMQHSTSWPQSLSVTSNGHLVELRRKFHWQADYPASITSTLQPGRNRIQIATMNGNNGQETWFLAVERIVWMTLKEVRLQVTKQKEAVETTMERLQALFASSDPDIEILTETVTLNVRDPFSSGLVACPIRSKACEHMECFDLDTYLNSRPDAKVEQAAVWRCPICGSDARPPNLVTVTWMEGILDSLKADAKDAHAVHVRRDGGWTTKPDDVQCQSANLGKADGKDQTMVEVSSSGPTIIELD